MSRTGIRALSCAVLVGSALLGPPVCGGDVDQRQKHLLAVQVSLERGQELLQRGDFSGAVAVLEKQIPYIDGNRRYLNALRDAYRGYVRQLEVEGKTADARKYRMFLEILETPARPAASVAASTAAPTPLPASASAPPPAPPQATMVASPAPPSGPPAPVHRGKAEEDDPFADSNSATKRAGGALERAERAFGDRNYETASRLYAQAEKLNPGSTGACQERWGYCKLHCVVQTLNRANGDFAPALLEQEVRLAVRMAPRLEKFGQSLLDRLQNRDASPAITPEVKHTQRQGNNWALAETANFRILHATSEETAEKVARIAETVRVTMTRKWFGEEPRGNWSPRCDIYLHPTGQGYARATGAPATAPGHSTISLDAGRVIARRIDLRGDDPNLLVGVLPHETTHVVLAGRFGNHHVPRWADEGMAVLSEPRERIELHLRNLPSHRSEGILFTAGELVKLNDYPQPRRIGPFYAQSVSLVDFLCKKKDPETFARFLREALDGRFETALERHYGYRSFADLDREWADSAAGGSVAAVAEKRR